ncbi:hypothetical protein Glove_132g43 [Diversispora epigaea]|uniref:Uncharacterized protein n=1 Tax=Diversispora epigaea TaxID=1348612 RepID=A0A397J493_9GLOM|nr:hypothetical protein Glove_132g43 [Diversispora epigaea]
MSTTKDIEKMYKGSFSYYNDEINSIDIDTNTKVKIERIDEDAANLNFVDNKDIRIPIPDDIVLKNTSNKDQVLSASNNQFPVTRGYNYTLYKKGNPIFYLETSVINLEYRFKLEQKIISLENTIKSIEKSLEDIKLIITGREPERTPRLLVRPHNQLQVVHLVHKL